MCILDLFLLNEKTMNFRAVLLYINFTKIISKYVITKNSQFLL